MDLVDKAIPECNELISIFVKSIETATRNLDAENRNRKRNKNQENKDGRSGTL